MKPNRFHHNTIYACMLSLAASGAFAQGQGQLEEVIVVAQKKLENLQEVPLAVSAFTESTLERVGITNNDDLALLTPGLQSGRQIGSSTPFLRGIGTQSSAAGDESSIATYVDGVYSPSMGSNTMMFNNIERIEVLKGPQGTLFGRNATGGLINITTKDPSREFSGDLEVSYATYETTGAKGYVTGALTDSISANFAFIYSDQSEGWGENRFTGNDTNLETTKAVRTKFAFDISEDTNATLGLNYAQSESDIGISRQMAPGALGADGLFTFLGCTGAGGSPAACAPVAAANATTYTGDWYDVNSNLDAFSDKEDWSATLHVNHSFETLDLLSITAYQHNQSPQLMDVDTTPLSINDATLDIKVETVSQEFQLTSAGEGNYEWMLGLFFMQSTSEYTPFGIDGLGVPQFIPGAVSVRSYPELDTQSLAAFYQATYHLSDETSLTGGLRFTRDERELSTDLRSDFGGGFVTLDKGTIDESWSEPTWRLSIDHKLTDDIMLYGTYSRGFKSGVYNLAGDVAGEVSGVVTGTPSTPVDPEILDAFEVGVKSDLLDRRLRLNASAFFYKYDDIQVQLVENGQARLLNAAEAEIKGIEAEVVYLLAENLTVSSGISLIDSEYKKFEKAPVNTPTGFGANSPSLGDLSGNELIRAPDTTVNVGVQYLLPTANGEFAFNVHYFYNSGFFWEPENRLEQEDYEVVNVELGWKSPSEQWSARLYGKNLLDEEYSYYSNSSQLGDAISAAPPLTYGVAVGYHF